MFTLTWLLLPRREDSRATTIGEIDPRTPPARPEDLQLDGICSQAPVRVPLHLLEMPSLLPYRDGPPSYNLVTELEKDINKLYRS